MKILAAITGIMAVSLIGTASQADVLAQYDFTNNRISSDSDLNSVASTFDNGPGITTSTYYTMSPSSVADPSLSTAASDTTNAEASAVSSNDYYTFTLTPNAGEQATLANVAFNFAVFGNANPSASFALYSSADNFTNRLGAVVTTTSTNSFTFAAIGLGNQTVTSAITFRLYVFDNNDDTGQGDLLDHVTVNGTVSPIPEPSTYALFGLGVGLLGAVQRFRRRRA